MTSSGPLRIAVIGAECTGKTTLAMKLARHYAAPIVRDYTREYFGEKLARGDASVRTADLVEVTRMQAKLEDQAARWTGPVIICDTDVFNVAVWHERYLLERREEIVSLANERRASGAAIDLYLLCTPDGVPFIPDGVRTSADLRAEMHETFRMRVIESRRPFIEMSGSLDERFAVATGAIDGLIRARARSA